MAKSKVTDAEIIETVLERFENATMTASEALLKKAIRKLKAEAGVQIQTEFRSRAQIVEDLNDAMADLMGDQVVAVAKTVGVNDKDIIAELEHKADIEARRGELQKTLISRVGAARAALREAEKIADDIGVEFYFDVAYGMGGTYVPKGHTNPNHWSASDEILEEGMWMASSQSC